MKKEPRDERDESNERLGDAAMIILLVLILLAPALISVMLFEKFKGCELSIYKRIALFVIFAYLINMTVYASIWLRGWENISWALDSGSDLYNVAFCLKYMALSLVSAVIIPFVLSLVKIGKGK